MTECTHLTIADGSRMPSVGLGLWKIDNSQTAEMVYRAIEAGYRHIDAACDYGNEQEAGEGIRRALQEGLCMREELWVTSKLWNTYHRRAHVRPALERSLHDLGLDYLDLYLVHFPIPLKYVPIEKRYPPGWFFDTNTVNPRMELDQVPVAETWGAMEEIHREGLVRHIGVSNFGCSMIRDLLSYAATRPAVLQVESHPYLTQEKLLRFCQGQQIAYTAFSPLGAGSYVPMGTAEMSDSVLEQPLIKQLAEKYGKSPAQITLRWGVARGTAVIPKTSRIARLSENLNLFDFSLSAEETLEIDHLNRHQRYNDPGVFCEQAFGCFFPIYE
ncbi:aldo/keto reductase [Aureliella helgolandensis]|uniref:2,5-diketo-D-gluconic acid reductase A n=1 Tax=Aureliella helgolandensis TaxID=2527968 RepID=A0A518G6E8_9BACT|nr:aldo/keto reductase [Aureliella helgolandensis]QDV24161.1 2,5-diketo-D-gluconic acid reductase A [Aureliella helgolandensis]